MSRIHRGILISIALICGFSAGDFLRPSYGIAATLRQAQGSGEMGQLLVYDLGQNQRLIDIYAEALDAESVYTVWLVKRGPEPERIGVGGGDHLFKSDERGIGAYLAILSASEIERWDWLEIAYHPDGLASNVEDMEIVLQLNLNKVR
jgi:hypothetical protein